MANRAKLSKPVAMRCDMVAKAGNVETLTNNVSMDEMAILQATGVPMAKRPTKLMIKTSKGIYSMAFNRI